MGFLSCIMKRHALKKGKKSEEEAPKQPHEQARVTAPTPMGQVETERLLSGDARAGDDLKALLARAERASRQVPQLNLNVRATEKWLQGSPEAIDDLLKEQQLAQMRIGKAASQQWLCFNLMRNSSLIGESFKHSFRDWFDDSLSSAEVEDAGCRSHWQLRHCPDGEGCNAVDPRPLTSETRPVATEDINLRTERTAMGEEGGEEDKDFPFDDYFPDEEAYRRSLFEVTAFSAKPAQAKLVLIPARTSSLRRKRGQSSQRRSSGAGIAGPIEAAPSERWSTQARTGSHGSLMGEEMEEGAADPDEHVPRGGPGVRQSVLLSLTDVPLSVLPAIALPPSPAASWPLRSSWPLPVYREGRSSMWRLNR